MVTGTDHIAINVISMEESILFYEKLLGQKKEEAIDMGDHVLQYFQLNGIFRLELIWYRYDTETAELPVNAKGIYRHLALSVENLEEFSLFLTHSGVTVKKTLEYCETLGFYNMLILDPNGIEIELVERIDRLGGNRNVEKTV